MKIEVKITDEAGNVQQYVVSGSLPSREDARNEGRKRFKGRNHILWKSNIFSAGAMWMLMKLTGISDVVGNNR